MSLCTAAIGLGALAGVGQGQPPNAACGFHPVVFHRIDDRRHISCADAKAVLLRLRGHRRTIPMVCGGPRVIGGWTLTTLGRQHTAVVNRYARGSVSFVYLREQHARRQYCPPLPA